MYFYAQITYIHVICISLYIINTYVRTDTRGYLCWEYLVNVSWNESWWHFSLDESSRSGFDVLFHFATQIRILDPAASAILISVRCLVFFPNQHPVRWRHSHTFVKAVATRWTGQRDEFAKDKAIFAGWINGGGHVQEKNDGLVDLC